MGNKEEVSWKDVSWEPVSSAGGGWYPIPSTEKEIRAKAMKQAWDDYFASIDKAKKHYLREFKGLKRILIYKFLYHTQPIPEEKGKEHLLSKRCGSDDGPLFTRSNAYSTKKKVLRAIKSGKLSPCKNNVPNPLNPDNYGKVSHAKVCLFLGLPDPEWVRKVERIKSLEKEIKKLRQDMREHLA
jgi:hypothetical protein